MKSNYSGLFGDKRLEKRGAEILKQLGKVQSSSIRRSFPDRAQQKGCYRFLSNDKVTEEALIKELTSRCVKHAKGRHLLVIQDSTSFNLNNHFYRLKQGKGIGTIEDNWSLGYFLHASLVVDSFSGDAIGYSDVQLWHRNCEDPDRKKRISGLPLEEKESYKWLRASMRSCALLKKAGSITFVEDRDGDIYEQYARLKETNSHFVIRSCKERLLSNGKKLYPTLRKEKISGTYSLRINGEPRRKRKLREASIDVRFKKVCIKKPGKCINQSIEPVIELYAVEANERKYRGEGKVCWRLLTTHQIDCYEDAVRIIEIYRKRWHIEQLFRLLKKQGFEMEESQLEEGWAIRKLSILALSTTLKVLQLMHAKQEGDQSVDEVFSKNEQKCLDGINKQIAGKTAKTSNPYTKNTLMWARWIIAKLGGWKGYSSQRVPGPITLKRGVDRFTQMFEGWCIAKDVGTQ